MHEVKTENELEVQFCLRMSRELKRRLAQEAFRQDRSMGSVMRRILNDWSEANPVRVREGVWAK